MAPSQFNMFAEDELEAAARSGTPQEAKDLVMTSVGLVSSVRRSPEVHATFKEGHLLGDVRSKFGSWYACPPSNEPVTFLYEPQQTMQAAIERLFSLTWKWRA